MPPQVMDAYKVGNVTAALPADMDQEEWMALHQPQHPNPLSKADLLAADDPQLLLTGGPYAEFMVGEYAECVKLASEWDCLADIDKWLDTQRNLTHTRDLINVRPDSLNKEQREVFDVVLAHHHQAQCHDAPADAAALSAIVLGKAGTGKSHLLFALRSALGSECVLLAPTGVAASNIQGHTIHSKLAIPVSRKSNAMDSLAPDALLRMQEAWLGVQYIFIDEISMVGQSLLGKIDRRLREIFSTHKDVVFGGRSVLFFGDFGQLPPVADRSVYSANSDKTAPSKVTFTTQGRLAYLSIRSCFMLQAVIRQEGDQSFRQLLQRLHQGVVTEEDWRLLCQRDNVTSLTAKGAPFEDALRLFSKKADVTSFNMRKLRQIKQQSGVPVLVMQAEHIGSKKAVRASTDDASGLEGTIALCVGAKVMLTRNLWVDCGLVNGKVGTVLGIVYDVGVKPPSLPLAVLVQFDNYSGPCLQPHSVVPIVPRTSHWMDGRSFCQRTQLPLRLCWATTIHKAQGLTLDKAVVNVGKQDFSCGLTYVALSRVRQLQDLCVHPIDFQRLQAISKSSALKERQKEEKRLRALSNCD
jgi:hypothetical protein